MFHRVSIRSLIDQVEVVDAEIRIFGRRTERLAMAGGAAPAGVPSFVRCVASLSELHSPNRRGQSFGQEIRQCLDLGDGGTAQV